MSERMIDGCHGNHQRVETSRCLHDKCQLLDVHGIVDAKHLIHISSCTQHNTPTCLLAHTWLTTIALPSSPPRAYLSMQGGLGMTDSCHQSDGEQFDRCQLAITGGLTAEFYNRSASTCVQAARNAHSVCTTAELDTHPLLKRYF